MVAGRCRALAAALCSSYHETRFKGAPASAQPVHIHKGSCTNLDPKPAFPLSPLTGGKSETVVNASLDDLEKGGYAINGHKSAQDLKTYVFCGDVASK